MLLLFSALDQLSPTVVRYINDYTSIFARFILPHRMHFTSAVPRRILNKSFAIAVSMMVMYTEPWECTSLDILAFSFDRIGLCFSPMIGQHRVDFSWLARFVLVTALLVCGACCCLCYRQSYGSYGVRVCGLFSLNRAFDFTAAHCIHVSPVRLRVRYGRAR
jgi:hypothetical protein